MSEALAELARAVSDVRAELAVLSAEVSRLRSEVVRSREEMAALRMAVSAPEQQLLPFASPAPSEQLVTLDQMAAIVKKHKRSLERYRDSLPPPRVAGRRGRAALWVWAEVRSWLAGHFGMPLPESFPMLPAS